MENKNPEKALSNLGMEEEEIANSLERMEVENPDEFFKWVFLFNEFAKTYWDYERERPHTSLRTGYFFGELNSLKKSSSDHGQIIVIIPISHREFSKRLIAFGEMSPLIFGNLLGIAETKMGLTFYSKPQKKCVHMLLTRLDYLFRGCKEKKNLESETCIRWKDGPIFYTMNDV